MDISQLLQSAWRLTWRHKVLWFFGFFLALSTASSPWWIYNWDAEQPTRLDFHWDGIDDPFLTPRELRVELDELARAIRTEIPADVRELVVDIIVVVGVALLIWLVVAAVLRYVSESGTIALVQAQQETGQMGGLRAGLALGWSAGAWRLFLIDLLLRLPLAVLTLAWLALSAAPFLVWYGGTEPLTAATVVLSGMLLFTGGLVVLLAAAAVALFTQVARRACLVEDLGAVAAVRRGWFVLRTNFGSALVVALLVLAFGLLWSLAAVPLFALIFPISLTTTIVGSLVVGLPTAVVVLIAETLEAGPLAFVIIGLLALPVFLLIALAPLLFLAGLVKVFLSNVWTLAYRQMIGLPLRQPAPTATGPQAAGASAAD